VTDDILVNEISGFSSYTHTGVRRYWFFSLLLFWPSACVQKTHKIIHDLAKGQLTNTNADGTYNPFPSFGYTGVIRPRYPLSPKREVPEHIPRPEYADDPQGGLLFRAGRALREAWRMSPVGLIIVPVWKGYPKTEMRASGQPPRILSLEEQEKMRTVCRVRFIPKEFWSA
jgi:methionyl aminopeptidase